VYALKDRFVGPYAGGKKWLEVVEAAFKGSVQSLKDETFHCVCAGQVLRQVPHI